MAGLSFEVEPAAGAWRHRGLSRDWDGVLATAASIRPLPAASSAGWTGYRVRHGDGTVRFYVVSTQRAPATWREVPWARPPAGPGPG